MDALLRHSSDVVVVIAADETVSYVSPAASHFLGYTHDTELGPELLKYIHPEDRLRLRETLEATRRSSEQQRTAVELRVAHADGTWHDVELIATNGTDDPAVRGVVCNVRDVTDLLKARQEVASNGRRFEAMLANLSDVVSVIDADGNMTYVSPATDLVLGREAQDRLGASIFDYVHPDDVAATTARLGDALLSPGLVAPFETRVRHEDGTYRIFEVRANNLLGDPAVNGIIVNSRDVTDRVNAETALHANERFYRTIVETADEGIWMVDANNLTTFVNRRMADLLGVTNQAAIGRHLFEFMNNAGLQVAARNLERRRRGVSEKFDFEFVRDDGTTFWAIVSACPFIDDDGTYQGSIALVTDLTDRRQAEANLREAELQKHRHEAELERHRLEAELDQARRLESLGRLAAGVAHDFNNLIGVILNYASVVAKQLDENDAASHDVARIQRAAEQAADVTRKLLIFGRGDAVAPEVFDLNHLLEEVTELVGRSFQEDVNVLLRLSADHCPIRADRGQIEQLVTNLLVNARDALVDGGTVIVSTHIDCSATQTDSDVPAQQVVLTVADDGVGMPPDALQRVFEPFFTTKPAGRGTGLGLATVHTIATRAGGQVTIKSEQTVGTTVRVRLPIVGRHA